MNNGLTRAYGAARRRLALPAACLLASALSIALCSTPASAQATATETVLHSFGDGTAANDGAWPAGNLAEGPDGDFYGGTIAGGIGTLNNSSGVIYKISPAGQVTIVHLFNDGTVPYDGAGVYGGLTLGPDGDFYGSTIGGGTSAGTLFKLTLLGQETILADLGDLSVPDDGLTCYSNLTLGTDGDYYGTTYYGGTTRTESNQGLGTVFKMTPSGQVTTLHSFGDGTVANDGALPVDSLVEGADGDFYGTTSGGGATTGQGPFNRGYGTAFKITPDGEVTILHSFGDGSVPSDAEVPDGNFLIGTDGNFYGTSVEGGAANFGTIFEMTPSGQVTILHSFGVGRTTGEGDGPDAGLIYGPDGAFYGTTMGSFGGNGTVFRMDPATHQVTTLHVFGDGSVPNDGSEPIAGVTEGTDGNLYGTTQFGGAASEGTVFKIVLPSGPAVPTGLIATAGNGQVQLSWNSSAGATSYNIYESTASGGEGGTPILTGVTQTNQTVTSLNNGTTYYFEVSAVNGNQESAKSSEASAEPFAPIIFPAGLQMFSVPYHYQSPSLNTILGYSSVELAVWVPSSNSYALSPTEPADAIRIGQGYWARFPQQVTMTQAGTPADTTQNFDISLTEGWNMIGDPFLVAVPISGLLFNGGTETFAQATTGGSPLIGPVIYAYSPSAGQYASAASLEPEQGYWIFAYGNTDVQVPHP